MPQSLEQDLERILGALANLLASDGNTRAVSVIANGKATIRETEHDNWDGGQSGYTITIEVPQQIYQQLDGRQNEIEETLSTRAREFSRLYTGQWIAGFVVTTELVQDPQWREKASHWCEMANESKNDGSTDSEEPVVIRTTTPDQEKFPDLTQIQSAVLKD